MIKNFRRLSLQDMCVDPFDVLVDDPLLSAGCIVGLREVLLEYALTEFRIMPGNFFTLSPMNWGDFPSIKSSRFICIFPVSVGKMMNYRLQMSGQHIQIVNMLSVIISNHDMQDVQVPVDFFAHAQSSVLQAIGTTQMVSHVEEISEYQSQIFQAVPKRI